MTLVATTDGMIQLLKGLFNDQWASGGRNLKLRLFTNNITPISTHHLTSYEEVSGGGYTEKTLTNGQWLVSTVGNVAQAAYSTEVVWTFSGAIDCAKTIYGYYIADLDASPYLWWAEKLATPFIPATTGLTLRITPTIQIS